MKKQYIYSALVLMTILSAGCAKEFENSLDSSDGSAIELSSVSTDPMTKAVITGTSFTTDEAAAGIGLFLLDANGKAYGNNAGNVRYAHNDGKWTASQPLRIGNTKGTLVGYYPYSEGATNVKAIPVASSINGTDYLYGSIAEITSAKAKTESLTLSHALTRLRITFKRDASFEGSGTLSSLSIEGDGIAASGTLDATTGEISATNSAFTVSNLNANITEEGITEDCLVVPAASSATPQAVTLKFTVDGKAYKVDLKNELAVKLQSGIQTDITLTVKNTSVSVDGSSIGAWGDGGSQTVTVGGNYTVTIKLDEDIASHDVLTDVYVDGNSVIVNAWSKSGQHLKCLMSDGNFCTSQSKTGNLVYTFNISDVTENTTATIGYAISTSIAVSPANAGDVEIIGLSYSDLYWEYHFEGETFKHKAIPNEGYVFVNWQDQYGNILCESEEYTFRPSSKVDVTAVFQRGVSLKVFVSPSFAGSVSAFENSNAIGTEITLTTTPCGNSVFNGWKDKDGNILSIENTYAFTIESDTILIADYSVDCGKDALNGVFTVAADNGYGKPKKVRFSKGNLWYGGTNGTSKTFNFEDDQWEYQIPMETAKWEHQDHISHFMWSKDAEYSILQYFSESESELSVNDVFFTNSSNFAVNGVSVWCTLSYIEWTYLLNSRATTYGSGELSTDNHRYAAVKVNDMAGLLIFPDEFTWPSGAGDQPSTFNAAESDWNGVNYKDAAFDALQSAGCVFLPAAGYRDGYSGDTFVYRAGSIGFYWSASSYGYYYAYDLSFNSGGVAPFLLDDRNQAYAVRLVTECK